jgi:succinate dehydrogenase / fumarate reductase membrane anchor subunit
LNVLNTRALLTRLSGLGIPSAALRHWWLQRLTAVALVPLSLWFMAALVTRAPAGHAALVEWIGSPLVALGLLLLVASLFYHAVLGIEEVVQDYVHVESVKQVVLTALRFGLLAAAAIGVMAVLWIALFGA